MKESHETKQICYEKIRITDDYMFCSVFEDEEKCRELLQRILGVEITELTVVSAQHTIKSNAYFKGVRLDIYAKDADNNAYDIDYSDFRFIPIVA